MAVVGTMLALFTLVAWACGVSGGVLPVPVSRPEGPVTAPLRDDEACLAPLWHRNAVFLMNHTMNYLTCAPPPDHDMKGNPSQWHVQDGARDVQNDTYAQIEDGRAWQVRYLRGDETEDSELSWLMQKGKRTRSPSPRRRRRHRREEEARRNNRQRWMLPSSAPASRRDTCSVVRFPPSRPWARATARRPGPREAPKSDMVEVETDAVEANSTGARGSRDPPPPIPTLDALEPGVRWWSDLIGLTNPLEEEDGEQRIICADTFRTIVANLQGQGREERARNIASLLSFFGLFLAEMMRAIWEAENGDLQVLLQTSIDRHNRNHLQWVDHQQGEEVSLMHRLPSEADKGFYDVVKHIQTKLETMSKAGAARIANCMGHFLREHSEQKAVAKPEAAVGRMETIGALMAAFEDNSLVTHDNVDPWCIDVWRNTLLPYLQVGRPAEAAGSTQEHREAAGVGELDDPSCGIRVRLPGGAGWRPATEEEARAITHHDAAVAQERRDQELHDQEIFAQHEAGRARDWEDWAVHSEMTSPSVARKRVRLTLVIGTASGGHVAEGVVEGIMPAAEQPMITMGMVEHAMPAPEQLEPAEVVSDAASAATQLVPPEEAARPGPQLEVDEVLLDSQGKEWYRQWKEDVVDDDMVRKRWGEAVVELFHATLAMELVIQSQPHPVIGQSSGVDHQLRNLESDEDRRAREIAEGAVDKRPGFVMMHAGAVTDAPLGGAQGSESGGLEMESATLLEDTEAQGGDMQNHVDQVLEDENTAPTIAVPVDEEDAEGCDIDKNQAVILAEDEEEQQKMDMAEPDEMNLAQLPWLGSLAAGPSKRMIEAAKPRDRELNGEKHTWGAALETRTQHIGCGNMQASGTAAAHLDDAWGLESQGRGLKSPKRIALSEEGSGVAQSYYDNLLENEAASRGIEGKEGGEITVVGDVDDNQVVIPTPGEDKHHTMDSAEPDETNYMQRPWSEQFATQLHNMLASDESGIPEEARSWCLEKWMAIQPLLEGGVQAGEVEQDTAQPHVAGRGDPCPSSVVETVEDSQDFVVENGSRVQIVRGEDGSQRPLTPQEREQIEFDEMVEEEAAEMERDTETRQWNLFAAGEYRSWEEWAVSADREGGSVKRARVQILVQGLGGRIVRDINWLIPLRDGEQLSYAVRVQPADTEEENEEPHPDAGPSGVNVVAAREIEEDVERPEETEVASGSDHAWRSMLPVTGWQGPPVLEEQGEDAKDIDVATFVLCPVGIRFYRDWVAQRVTCRLIGSRFGYGVLGKFYAIRDETKRLMMERHMSQEDAEVMARTTMAAATTQAVDLDDDVAVLAEEVAASGQRLDSDGADLRAPQATTAALEDSEGLEPADAGLRALPDEGGAASSTAVSSPLVSFADVLASLATEGEAGCEVTGDEGADVVDGGDVELAVTGDVALTAGDVEGVLAEEADVAAAGGEASTSERSEQGPRQTNLEHWLRD